MERKLSIFPSINLQNRCRIGVFGMGSDMKVNSTELNAIYIETV